MTYPDNLEYGTDESGKSIPIAKALSTPESNMVRMAFPFHGNCSDKIESE